jgi:SMI1 / KNR4 family (SUKH-1)
MQAPGMSLDILIGEVIAHHFPNPPAPPESVLEFESKSGYHLPSDMRQFFLVCDGASLFMPKHDYPPFRVLRIAELRTARRAVYGKDDEAHGPAYHFVFCDRGDGDFVGIDLRERSDGNHEILDIWHESYPKDCAVITASFTSFLERALHSRGDSLFWFEDEARRAD